jgi:hypothetical protein
MNDNCEAGDDVVYIHNLKWPLCCMQRYMGEMDRERTDTGTNGKADDQTNGNRSVNRTTSTRAAAAMRGWITTHEAIAMKHAAVASGYCWTASSAILSCGIAGMWHGTLCDLRDVALAFACLQRSAGLGFQMVFEVTAATFLEVSTTGPAHCCSCSQY